MVVPMHFRAGRRGRGGQSIATTRASAMSRSPREALRLVLLALVAAAMLSHGARAAAGETPQAAATGEVALKPGDFRWTPEISPKGPLLIVVDLSGQLAYVYRNGVRIARSTVSSGKPGYETPTGVFTILQKDREHHSNLYDDAPMPFMQRLTWSGVALHAGKLPGRPASHGCIRLPYAFSEKLYGLTSAGMTVIVTDDARQQPEIATPGLFAPQPASSGEPSPEAPVPATVPAADAQTVPGEATPSTPDIAWTPDLSPAGPLSIVLGTRDQYVRVLRNGIEIGHASVKLSGEPPAGTRAYVVLEGAGPDPSPVVPGRPALRWLAVSVPRKDEGIEALHAIANEGRLFVPPEFAREVYDALAPGSVLVVTDEPTRAGSPESVTILRADAPRPTAPIRRRKPRE